MDLHTDTNLLNMGGIVTLLFISFVLGIAFCCFMTILYQTLIFKLFVRLREQVEADIKKSRNERLREVFQEKGIDSSNPAHPDYSDEDQVGTVGEFVEDPMTGVKTFKEI